MKRPASSVTGRRGRGSWLATAACLLLGLVSAQVTDEPPELGSPAGLLAPTSPAYAEAAWYDLVTIRWVEPDAATVWLEVELAAVDPGGPGPLGLRQPIIEVYVDDGGGGAASLLPGSGLRMPDGDGWRHAVRITGDGVWWWEATVDGRGLLPPRSLPAVLDGRVVRIAWPTDPPGDARVYAISGVYDPFSPDGWRPLARTPSPWAFASEQDGPPVIDVLPGGVDVWERVRDDRMLVRDPKVTGAGGGPTRWYWWVLMGLGLGIASGGLWWRSRPSSVAEAPSAEDAAAPLTEDAEPPAAAQNEGDDALISDAELLSTADGDAAPSQPAARPADADPSAAAGQPTAMPPDTGSDTGDAGEAGDVVAAGNGDADASSTRATDAPSDDSRSAKRS